MGRRWYGRSVGSADRHECSGGPASGLGSATVGSFIVRGHTGRWSAIALAALLGRPAGGLAAGHCRSPLPTTCRWVPSGTSRPTWPRPPRWRTRPLTATATSRCGGTCGQPRGPTTPPPTRPSPDANTAGCGTEGFPGIRLRVRERAGARRQHHGGHLVRDAVGPWVRAPRPATVGRSSAWRSPHTGTVRVVGGLEDSNAGGGDGVDWTIEKGRVDASGARQAATVLASGSFANGGKQDFTAGTGSEALDAVAVVPGG